uniref:DUF948 domain-containing protein n=1 Tax=candidate division WWE3 bacterium TaxID=2053526 RepID=A0A7C4TRK6_UNCKA
MDIQAILILILAVLTINLVVVGVYVILVLRELRETIKKANIVLENATSVSSLVSNPFGALSSFVSAFIEGYKAIKEVKTIRSLRD